jgi:hypothetical protein
MIKQHVFSSPAPKEPPEYYKEYYKVDRLAWAIALTSVGVAISIMYLVVHFATIAYRKINLEYFNSELTSSRAHEALEHLHNLFDGPPFLKVLPGSSAAKPDVSREIADQLVDTLGTLSPDELFGAEQQLALAAERARRQSIAPSKSFLILDSLRTAVEPLLARQQFLQQLHAKKEQLLLQRSNALSQIDLLAKDAADLFSLPPRFAESSAGAPSFYNSGILKSLPTLSGLPDNLTSLSQLRDELTRAGGRLQASGGAPIESLLNARLASLREGGSAVAATLQDLDSQLAELSSTIEADRDQLQERLRVFSEELRDKIRALFE